MEYLVAVYSCTCSTNSNVEHYLLANERRNIIIRM